MTTPASTAPVREFLYIVKESALGTVMASPTAGTDSIYIRLVDGNSFTMQPDPIFEEIPYGGGFAVTAEEISDHYECKGQLKTKLYPAQAQLLLDWSLTRINSGQTVPWTTSELPGDLASCSVYHAYRNQDDGSFVRKRYAGVKVSELGIAVSRQSTTAMITLGLQAARAYDFGSNSANPDATAFPAPTEDLYPTGPYTFSMSGGLLSIATTRTKYTDLSLKVTNALDGNWYETAYLGSLNSYGRDATLDATLLLKSTPDDRSAYEALTAKTCSLGLNNGTNTLTFTFNGHNRIKKLTRELPLNQSFFEKLTLKNVWDATALSGAGDDMHFAIA